MCRAAAHIVVWIMLEERAITVIAMTREMGSLDIRAFWAEFLVKTDREHNEPLYDIFHFDDNASDANELAELVLRGKKTATASLLWQYEASGKRPPRTGDLSVTDHPRCRLCASTFEWFCFV